MSSELDDLLAEEVETQDAEHPQIPVWASLIEDVGAAKIRLRLHRERDGLALSDPVLYLEWVEGRRRKADHHPYHRRLNSFLYERGVRAVTPENEGLRGAFWLKEQFEPGDIEYGDGFFSAVLFEVVRKLFGDRDEILAILGHIARSNVDPRRRQHAGCTELVRNTIRRYGAMLKKLGYSPEEVKTVVAAAVRDYLDERFHVTTRRMLGLFELR